MFHCTLKNKLCQTRKSLTKDQLSLLKKMKQEYGYNDEKLNQFKLMIYNWNINNVIEYYNNDSFCCHYCIGKRYKYGCAKRQNQCPFAHSKTMNLYNLIFGNSNVQPDYQMAKLLCLYLMSKKVYNDNNSKLFVYYGELLRRTGTRMQDYLKCEQYFLKSLSIDNNNGYAHNNYAVLLENKLHNFDKAEYHYKKALEIDPNSAIKNYNFALFLNRQSKYKESLIYINKACELQPNASEKHELKGEILYNLNKYEESIDETIHALKLNENDGYMTNNGSVHDAKQLIEESIKNYMIEKLNIQYYFNFKEFEGCTLIEWLYDNQLLSIKSKIFSNEISMKILLECKQEDLDALVKEMKLKTTTKIKFRKSFETLQQQKQEDKNAESTEETMNLISAHKQSDESKIDNVSVYSYSTSDVSSISEPFVINGALIVFLGIGDYQDKLQNLEGVSKDYQNILNIFVETWGYTAFYKTNKNITIYSNEIETVKLNDNYKLHWTIDEIEKFVEEARMYVVFNKHNGLIFVISSHGDTGKIIYDSEMEEYALYDVFNMFQPQSGQLLETYKETSQVSKRLFEIPKIFFIDSCRGSSFVKIENIKPDEKDDEQVAAKSNVNNNNSGNSNSINDPIKKSENEKISFKVVSKKKAEVLSSNYSNFCKIWANVDGYAVADGSINGGLFLRNVSKLFQHKKWILNHNLTDIIFKIRDYTKREATLIGLLNFTQLVENEGTMERPVRFDVFKENGQQHKLQEVNTNDTKNRKFKCDNCASIKSNSHFHCYECKYSLCQSCCHLKICAKKQQK